LFFFSCRLSSPNLVVFQFSAQYFRGVYTSSFRHFFAKNRTRNLMLTFWHQSFTFNSNKSPT
jgi:hypothetical protein